jgi:thiamine-phosphate pyrophosphorylase
MTERSANVRSALYAIIDLQVAQAPIELAERALEEGCAWLQLRAKKSDDRTWLETASALRERCTRADTPFVINDRADIARIVGADGLHLGQDDLRIEDARMVVGDMKIGVSTHDLDQALQANAEGADLIAFGPVFGTATKENPDPAVGLESLAAVCRSVQRPVVAIGGITPENAAETLHAGARYIAVISALPLFIAAGEAQRASSKY